MVSGSLLGLSAKEGILEITHSFPFPEKKSEFANNNDDGGDDANNDDENSGLDGHEYQLEMMRMLREVNVDNNCIGWYQSMYLGSYSTSSLLENQLGYQTGLSPNAVVILYDPMQTSNGSLVLKCFRLTDECIALKASGKNTYLDPRNIFEEVPVVLTNPSLVKAFLCDISQGMHGDSLQQPTTSDNVNVNSNTVVDTCFDRLDLSTNPYLEKHLEFLCNWVDDLAAEQQKFQFYTKSLRNGGAQNDNHNGRNDWRKNKRNPAADAVSAAEGWASSDAPERLESLLMTNQIRNYCDQVDKFAGGGFSKLFLAGGLHKEERASSS